MINIIAFIGPSGSGKTTLQKKIGINQVVTWTSRKPREGELNGIHYHFADRETIQEMEHSNVLLEYTEYSGNLYASDLSSFRKLIESEQLGTIAVDASGASNLKKFFKEKVFIIGVYISKKECYERLMLRNDKTLERIETYEKEVQEMIELSNIVINNSKENWEINTYIVKNLGDFKST